MDIMERINVMKDCDLIDDLGYQDLLTVKRILSQDFQFDLTEENGGVMITHLGAAIKRLKTGETVEPLDPEVLIQAKEEPAYQTAVKILTQLKKVMVHVLPQVEEDFMLVHICNTLETE
jgi:transcriptional regulatory protein LevR